MYVGREINRLYSELLMSQYLYFTIEISVPRDEIQYNPDSKQTFSSINQTINALKYTGVCTLQMIWSSAKWGNTLFSISRTSFSTTRDSNWA